MHADILDAAAELQQQMIDNALANRPAQMAFTGECHYCEEPIDSGHFCSVECREDAERLAREEQQRRVS